MVIGRMLSNGQLALLAAIFVAFIFSIQYPASSSYPLGGDAAEYITTATRSYPSPIGHGSSEFNRIIGSHYPLSHMAFTLSYLIPVDWPARFIIFSATIHFLTALLLGLVVYKLGGWQASATVVVIWGLSTTTINRFFEDSTLAQQISLIPLALFILSLANKRPWLALLLLAIIPLTHPITGLIAFAATLITIPPLYIIRSYLLTTEKKLVSLLFYAILALLISGFFILSQRSVSLFNLSGSEESVVWPNLVRSFFGPFILTAPVGILALSKKHRAMPTATLWIMVFCALAAFTTFNSYLSIGFWSFRFQSYFVLAATIMSSLGIPLLFRTIFTNRPLRLGILCLLFTIVGMSAWNAHRSIYAWYESPSNYGRLNQDEMTAIHWLRDNLPPGSYISASTATRHAEWIEALTSLDLHLIPSITTYVADKTANPVPSTSHSYLMLFTNVEESPEALLKNEKPFKQLFSNHASIIYSVGNE